MNKTQVRFKIIEESFGSKKICTLIDSKTTVTIGILPFLGGSINSISLNKGGEIAELLDGYKDEDEAKNKLAASYKGSSLFPFANRIKDGKYDFKSKSYKLPINTSQDNNAIHGLIYDKCFDISDKIIEEDFCQLKLTYNSKGEPGYPFFFKLEQIYTLHARDGFKCSTKVTNLHDEEIPVAHGWHPYFKFPDAKIDELTLQFPAKDILELDNRNIPTGKTLPYAQFNTEKKIAKTKIDSCFSLERKNKAVISLSYPQKKIRLDIWQETGKQKYNYLQIYTPPHRNSIAVEPMTSPGNSFNNGIDLMVINPKSTIKLSWGINIYRVP
ncbi:MAG: hypothetical protein OCC45_01860 [Desulfotalea sp.]